jgi:hypothetical protein
MRGRAAVTIALSDEERAELEHAVGGQIPEGVSSVAFD